MKLKPILLCAVMLAGTISGYGQSSNNSTDTKQAFIAAQSELVNMLDGKAPLSYERAIFLIENAYWQGAISEERFSSVVGRHTDNIRKIIASQKPMPDNMPLDVLEMAQANLAERKEFYKNAIINAAIFKYITDTTFFIGKDNFTYHMPYHYSYEDPMGSRDWANTQVSHLLKAGNGNCFALASLFKIFSERLSSKAWLSTAPGHIYIRHADGKGTLYNIELSNGGSFPGTGTIETLTYSTPEAVRNNIALRDLNLKQSVALCLVNLAKGYQHKLNAKPDDFMLNCAEASLRSDSLCLNAMLLKSDALENRVCNKSRNIALLNNDKDFQAYEAWLTKLFNLGYREIPHEMKNLLVKHWTKDSITVVFSKQHIPNSKVGNGVVPTRYASLSWGMFDEVMHTKSIEQYGRAQYDTHAKKIIGFTEPLSIYNDYNFDPVAFAWNVDPMAHKFPHASPYNFVENNPIGRIDPTGAEWINAYDAMVSKTQQALLENPNDRQLKRLLNEQLSDQRQVNRVLGTLKSNDRALYDYIDKLQVIPSVGPSTGKITNVKVFVELEAGFQNTQTGEMARTDYRFGANVTGSYNGKNIQMPLTAKKMEGNTQIGFNVTLYNNTAQDAGLANESGDIMYFMEYNSSSTSKEDVTDVGRSKDEYLNGGSSRYSNKVQDTYKARSKETKAKGAPAVENPYPLEK